MLEVYLTGDDEIREIKIDGICRAEGVHHITEPKLTGTEKVELVMLMNRVIIKLSDRLCRRG